MYLQKTEEKKNTSTIFLIHCTDVYTGSTYKISLSTSKILLYFINMTVTCRICLFLRSNYIYRQWKLVEVRVTVKYKYSVEKKQKFIWKSRHWYDRQKTWGNCTKWTQDFCMKCMNSMKDGRREIGPGT
jgi:hypothetical protein